MLLQRVNASLNGAYFLRRQNQLLGLFLNFFCNDQAGRMADFVVRVIKRITDEVRQVMFRFVQILHVNLDGSFQDSHGLLGLAQRRPNIGLNLQPLTLCHLTEIIPLHG